MAIQSKTKKSKGVFGINWFTLILFIVMAFVFIQKDLSLNFNLNAPINVEKERPKKYDAPSQKVTHPQKNKPPKLTEKAPVKKVKEVNEKTGTSFFNFFSRGKKKKAKSLKSELDKIDESIKQGYLKRFAHVAVSEQEKFKIPASIILANALLHSAAGQTDMASDYNNHFAVACGDDWDGGRGSASGICYRTYETAWMSFRNHSKYITTGKYEQMVRYNSKDYRGWAKGIESLGFSDGQNLSKNLIQIIEQYGLNDLDE